MGTKKYAAIYVVLHTEYVDGSVRSLAEHAENAKPRSLTLMTMEWEDDRREIYQIPEARKLILDVVDAASVLIGSSRLSSALSMESIYLLKACLDAPDATANDVITSSI